MKNSSLLVALVSLRTLSVSAFSPSSPLQGQGPGRSPHTRVQAATATAPADAKVEVKTEVPVSRISVCAGELCQCQGEQYEYTGGASDAALDELRNLDLPFPVDEVGCLGACGLGTMVAIDFENGDSIMTDGLESTLAELGIERREVLPSVSEAESESLSTTGDAGEGVANESSSEEAVSSPSIPLAATATALTEETMAVPKKTEEVTKAKKPPMLADARDRMREEASDEVVNPWMNMAGYLAKKAADKMFGSERS